MRKLFTAAAVVLVVSVGFAVHAAVPPLDPERVGATQGDAAAIVEWFKGYDAAFNAKDLEQLAGYYHPDVTVYEGGGIDRGWAAYRDKHLGPELKAFENLQFAHHDLNVQLLDGGNAAYATARYTLKAKMRERDVDSEGLATYVLVKGADGAWKIRHSHTSSRPRRPAAQ
jgi:uncharacterized protein (TIGR02246 family)